MQLRLALIAAAALLLLLLLLLSAADAFEVDHALLLRLNQIAGYATLFAAHPWLYGQPSAAAAVKDYLVSSVSDPSCWLNIELGAFHEQVFVRTCAQLDELYYPSRDYFDALPTVDPDHNRNLLCRVSSVVRDCRLYRSEGFLPALADAMARALADRMLLASPPGAPSSSLARQAGQAGSSNMGVLLQQQQRPIIDPELLARVKAIKGYQILFEAHPWLFQPALRPVDAVKQYLIRKVSNPTAWIDVDLRAFCGRFFVRACLELADVYRPHRAYFDALPTVHADADANLLCRVSSILRDCVLYRAPDFSQDLPVSLLSTIMEMIAEGRFAGHPSPRLSAASSAPVALADSDAAR